MFIPVYHTLHDNYKVHSEITYFLVFSIFLCLSWIGDRNGDESARPKPGMEKKKL